MRVAASLRWDASRGGGGHICPRADTIGAMLGVDLSRGVLLAGLTAACSPTEAGDDARRDVEERFVHEVASVVALGGSLFTGVVEDRWVPEVARGLRGYHRLTSGGS